MADAGRDNWSLSLRAGSRLTPALSRRALIFARELALYALVDQSESSHRLPSVSRSRFRGARRPRNLRSSRSRLGRDVDYVKYEPSWPELRWGRRNGTGGGREGKGPEKTGNARRCASRFCMRLLSGCESPSRALPLFLPVSFLPPPLSLSLSLFRYPLSLGCPSFQTGSRRGRNYPGILSTNPASVVRWPGADIIVALTVLRREEREREREREGG